MLKGSDLLAPNMTEMEGKLLELELDRELRLNIESAFESSEPLSVEMDRRLERASERSLIL